MSSIVIKPERLSINQSLRRKQRNACYRILLTYLLLTILALITLVPIIWMILTAFKAENELSLVPPTWWPRVWQPENFVQAWNFAPFGGYLLNTLFVAGSITVLKTITSALAAYAFARLRFPGRNGFFLLYLSTLIVPSQVTVIPLFILMKDLSWVNTFQGLIIPQAFTAFGTFLLRQFFLTIPYELEDAARMDGASRLRCFIQIILPLSKTALATLAIFVFLMQWNNLLWPLIMSNGDATALISVGLLSFRGEYAVSWNLLMAAATLAILPIAALYIFAQRWFVRGIVISGFGGR
ncbi:sugar ABC transporter permease [Reticulibacter mediterranei]|uniref:Sugar ABC transporter permease n=1 Tax=Reticulibacter mediterranei TaxID=2778369 RepID=A0A8J3IQQ1_9CHLR|nr:carbohydrate ABC transporter permease [Reticulibacter mediterranei]GHP00215.1 sugar ABC transporter permease [Reticulibacter mediterranei]